MCDRPQMGVVLQVKANSFSIKWSAVDKWILFIIEFHQHIKQSDTRIAHFTKNIDFLSRSQNAHTKRWTVKASELNTAKTMFKLSANFRQKRLFPGNQPTSNSFTRKRLTRKAPWRKWAQRKRKEKKEEAIYDCRCQNFLLKRCKRSAMRSMLLQLCSCRLSGQNSSQTDRSCVRWFLTPLFPR